MSDSAAAIRRMLALCVAPSQPSADFAPLETPASSGRAASPGSEPAARRACAKLLRAQLLRACQPARKRCLGSSFRASIGKDDLVSYPRGFSIGVENI